MCGGGRKQRTKFDLHNLLDQVISCDRTLFNLEPINPNLEYERQVLTPGEGSNLDEERCFISLNSAVAVEGLCLVSWAEYIQLFCDRRSVSP